MTIKDQEPFKPLIRVAIIMPALNEEQYISQAIQSLAPKDPTIDYEIIVADGGSTDATRQIVEKMQKSNPRIKLIYNEGKYQSAAVNKACDIVGPSFKYLIRADCHSQYPPEFVSKCVRALEKTGAASVVVPMKTIGVSSIQKAIAAAQNSLLGNGGARHRNLASSCYVDHGHHAGFDRKIFLKLGGYNERMTHNEDAEFDHRLSLNGYKIWMESGAEIQYFPRNNFASLAEQYYKFGRGRARTWIIHNNKLRFRQTIPVLSLMSCILSFFLSIWVPYTVLIPLIYVLINLIYGLVLAIRYSSYLVVLSGVATIIMQISWAAGFLLGVIIGRR